MIDDRVEIGIAHRDRAAADMGRDIGLQPRQHVVAADLADPRSRHAAGVDFHLDAALVAPAHIPQRFVAQLFVTSAGQRIEDELGEDRADGPEPVEVLLGHARHQDHRAGVYLGPAPAHPSGRRGRDHGQRGHQLRGEILVIEPGHVQLARGDHGGGAAMDVVADPALRVLRRRPFAEHGVDVTVDQARHHGGAAGVEHAVGLDGVRRIECGNPAVADEQRLHRRLRPRDVAGEELADILDEQARHRGPRLSLPRKSGRSRSQSPVGRTQKYSFSYNSFSYNNSALPAWVRRPRIVGPGKSQEWPPWARHRPLLPIATATQLRRWSFFTASAPPPAPGTRNLNRSRQRASCQILRRRATSTPRFSTFCAMRRRRQRHERRITNARCR